MLFSDTDLSTSRFISPSFTKANCSPILTLILIVNLTRLEVSSDIPQFYPGYIWSHEAFRPIARKRKYLMDYNGSYTMAAKPVKFLELHYTMIQFLIILRCHPFVSSYSISSLSIDTFEKYRLLRSFSILFR